MAKAHDEGTPFVRINMVFSVCNQDGWMDVGPYRPNLERKSRLSLVRASAKRMNGLEDRFQLDWAFTNTWRLHQL